MKIDANLDRAKVLIEHAKYGLAEQELRGVLTFDPENAEAMGLIAICLINQNKGNEALDFTQRIVHLHPDNAYNLYLHSMALYKTDRLKEAEEMIREAIHIDPWDADYFGLLAGIKIQKKDWKEALESAEKGLEIDANNLTCLNYRTYCLTKLNRKEEANQTIQETLTKDPDNAFSHTNVGWSKLEQGDYETAKIHFAEALRLRPSMEEARLGMVEALKAKNIIYRAFLNFFFWLAKFKGKAQWGIIIALYIGNRLLSTAARKYPFLIPLVVLVAVFFYLTWIIQPLFNLFLRLDKHGRYALSEKEVKAANIVGISLLTAIVSFALALIYNVDTFFFAAIYFGTIVIPVSALFSADTAKEIKVFKIYTIAMAVVGLLAVILVAAGVNFAFTLGMIYLVALWLFGWVANSIAIRT